MKRTALIAIYGCNAYSMNVHACSSKQQSRRGEQLGLPSFWFCDMLQRSDAMSLAQHIACCLFGTVLG